MPDSKNAVQLMPIGTNSGWSYWPLTRIVILASFVLAAFAATSMGETVLGIACAVIGVGLILPSYDNKQYVYQTIMEKVRNVQARRHDRKSGPYRTPPLKEVIFYDESGARKRRSLDSVQPQIIPLEGGKHGYLTEVFTPSNGRHTLFATGSGHGAAVSGSPDQIVSVTTAFARAMAEVAAEHGPGVYGTLGFQKVPYSIEKAVEYFDKHRLTPTSDHDIERQRDYLKVLAKGAEKSNDFLSTVAISVPRPRTWGKHPIDQIPSSEIRNAPGYKMMDLLVERLRGNRVSDIHLSTPYDVATLFQASTDLTEIHDFYADRFTDMAREKDGTLRNFTDSLVMANGFIPQDWEPQSKHLRIGGTFHRMFFIPDFRHRAVEAGTLQHLFNSPYPIWYGIATVYETTPIESERRRVNSRRIDQDARSLQRAERGSSGSAKATDEASAVSTMDSLMYHSTNDAVKANFFAWVSADSLKGLDEASAMLRKMFRDVDLPLQLVAGASLQVPVRLATIGIRSDRI